MNLQHVNVKIFVDGELQVEPNRFIELFHGWIVRGALDEFLIDVADYRHVPHGPSVILIGHEADYALDHTHGLYGLLYNRKAPLDGENADRFLQSLCSAAKACLLLEAELNEVRFRRSQFELFINDRALAPNTPETHSALEADLSAFLQNVLGVSDFTFESADDSRLRVGTLVHLTSPLELDRLAEVT